MRLLSRLSGRRGRAVALAGAGALAAALVIVPAGPAHAAIACEVTYTKAWDNGSGFGANLALRNLGDPLNGWALTFAFPGNQRVTEGWPVLWTQPAGSNQVTAQSNAPWNAVIATGATFQLGFNGNYSGANVNPTAFSVNGVACAGPPPPNAPPTVAITSPANGATFNAPANVTVNATASDSNGTVTVVDFFRNGMLVGSDTTAPYSFTNTALPAGNYTLQARATDNGGATATAQVSIVVNQPTGPVIQVSPVTLVVPEGGTASYNITLSAAPPGGSIVVISARTAGDTDITVSVGAQRTFTTANFATPQSVTLAAAQDADSADGQATITVSAPNLASVLVTANEDDDEGPPQSPYV